MDDQLVKAVIAANPVLLERIKFVPNVKSASCNGMYYCDPSTNVWSQEHNVVLEKVLIEMFDKMQLTKADKKHIQSRRGRGDILYSLAAEVVDKKFTDTLDANLDLFAVDNGGWDTSDDTAPPRFRPLTLADGVATTTGWKYDPVQAAEKRSELDAFLAMVLPVEEERTVCLKFVASLLSGRRNIKKFLEFTDRRAGNNGKSTLVTLFKGFFGKYTAKKGTAFVLQGSFERNRNDHDAGLSKLRGKRLLVAEELKSTMRLDDAMIKQYTGGALQHAGGREFHEDDEFSFVWQAGFILVFNQDQAPKCDTWDAALMERIIVVPMRSKFVGGKAAEAEEAEEEDEPYTYPVLPGVTKRFPSWFSALADILVELYDPTELLTDIPASMKDWKAEIADGLNPLNEWLEGHLEVTHDKAHYVLLRDVFDNHYAATVPLVGRADFKTFVQHTKGWLLTHGLVYKALDKPAKINGEWPSMRHVVRGVNIAQIE
jgi:hypothetical protein